LLRIIDLSNPRTGSSRIAEGTTDGFTPDP